MSLNSLSHLENGLLYFTSADELFNYKTLEHNLNLIPIQNFENCVKKFKTLLCHDMQGGYLCYDGYENFVIIKFFIL